MVTHSEFWSWLVMTFSSFSSPLHFRNFFTSDLTAFSNHFSSCSFLNSPFFHPSSRFSMGDVKGRRVLVEVKKSFSTPSTVPFIAELIRFTFTSSLPNKQRGGSRSPPSSTSKNWKETLAAPPDCNAIQVSRCSSSSRRCRSIPAPSPCALLHLRSSRVG